MKIRWRVVVALKMVSWYRCWLSGCLLAGFVLGWLCEICFPPQYSAVALIKVRPPTSIETQIIQPVATYAMLISSDALIRLVLIHYPMLDRQIFLDSQLKVKSDVRARTISIGVQLDQPERASEIANLLARSLVTQQNVSAIEQYNWSLIRVGQRLQREQTTLTDLQNTYYGVSRRDRIGLQHLRDQILQQQNLQNQDLLQQQGLQMQRHLASDPLEIIQSASSNHKPLPGIRALPLRFIVSGLLLIAGVVGCCLKEIRLKRLYLAIFLEKRVASSVTGKFYWGRNQAYPLKHLLVHSFKFQ